jgi:dTDP-4-dehydrorhamnose 3,5-epimerase
VLRGFHRERWDKFVYVVRGQATCAVADTRPASRTFGMTLTFELGDPPLGQRARLFISEGLSNAFYCPVETDYLNDVSEEFDPSSRSGVIWNDPTLNVPWPDKQPILSAVDRALPTLKELFPSHPLFKCANGRQLS